MRLRRANASARRTIHIRQICQSCAKRQARKKRDEPAEEIDDKQPKKKGFLLRKPFFTA
jgi:hypothetical protein